MIGQHGVEMSNFFRQACPRQSEKDDTSVAEASLEHQFAEILIGDNEDPFLAASDFQYLLIRKAAGMIARNRSDVVVEVSEVGNKSEVRALVEQKPYASAHVTALQALAYWPELKADPFIGSVLNGNKRNTAIRPA